MNKSDILTLPHKVESRNQLDRKHWAVKRQCKKIWALFVRNQMKLKKVREAEVGEKFKLTIISYRTRLLDLDNLYGGCKQLLDACSDEKLIWDDAPKYLDLKVEQHKSKKFETIIIREKS
ncbi:MAG: hypothetical protein Tp1122DCM00d2C27307611_18 [Prokaryotic dsDNA virus sp.]|nr:MAG: hypothetical protein Tp1122DCM00d2C27307611_18 [Prokaryotic dsDNA virus sp.]|tara:strand:- start:4306 stop:4665 length:360 start_codon:yes stop_codon:yes gene_type:complete